MKLTTFLLFVACLQVAARAKGQTISVDIKNAPIKVLFREIQKQTGLDVLVDEALLAKAPPVTLTVKNMPVPEVLNICFRDEPLSYSIIDGMIVVKPKANGMPRLSDNIAQDVPADIRVEGKVLNEKGEGLPATTITVRGTSLIISAGGGGSFSILLTGTEAILIVSHVGYKTKEVVVSGADVNLEIHLEPAVTELKDVGLLSTGYQSLPRERATGSFERVNNELFNRSTGPSVIARLDGLVPGLLFDKRLSPKPDLGFMTIRGQSTLAANKSPIIVLDNFPYDGDINNINPNDVESVTILKDAAAASIWGVRAGNGVIVITTKKGAYDRPLQVSFNSNVTIAAKPNLFYFPQMNTTDFIGVEKFLFGQGYYDNSIGNTSTYPFLSPVVDLLAQARSGAITMASANAQIDALGKNDVRNDYLKYFYRKQTNQQYAINLNGGSKTFNYMFSAGFDKGMGEIVKVGNDRITLRTDLSFKPLKNLEIQAGTIYTQGSNQSAGSDLNGQLGYNPSLPYRRFADDQGNPVVVGRDYLVAFATNPGDARLVNWQFKPLAELDASKIKRTNYDWLLNVGIKYQVIKSLSAEVKYNYQRSISSVRDWEGPGSYYTRNLYNMFTQPVGSAVVHPVPPGGIVDQTDNNNYTYNVRGQLNYDQTFGTKHHLTVIAGAEERENHGLSYGNRTYGYDDQNLSFQNVNSTTNFHGFLPQGGGTLPTALGTTDQTFRFTSIFTNGAYTYDNCYTLSASARKDASNLFGVNANQRGVPLWSSGLSWNVSNESFYKSGFLPFLKVRATYGYNGNTSSAISAFTTLRYGGPNPYNGLPTAIVLRPANDDLQWEKVATLNFGLDFGIKNNRLSGSIEYYTKKATNVLYSSPVPLSTGYTYLSTNNATVAGNGLEFSLHSVNLRGAIKWTTDYFFSYNQNKTSNVALIGTPSAQGYLGSGYSVIPIPGVTLFPLYAYKWAGLDPLTGDPQGYINKQVSKDYANLINPPVTDMQYMGSATPLYSGGLRNTFTYKNISVSVNITYQGDYYFRKSSTNYGALFGGSGTADFATRWQKPGDEKITNVPSMIYPDNYYRDLFYQYSSVLVLKADNIRLRDISASYSITKPNKYFKSIKLYANMSNLGLLWRANKDGIDPDYGNGYPAPHTIAFGLSAGF